MVSIPMKGFSLTKPLHAPSEIDLSIALPLVPGLFSCSRSRLTILTGVTYQWPEMSCSPEDKAISEIKHDVLASTMRSSATFYSIVFAGATHNAFAHTGLEVTRENKILRLAYKTHAIEALKNEIRSLSGKASDELLLCMFTLGTHGSGDTLAPRPGRTNDSTLITAQSFAFYGHMNWETAHFDAMRVLIEQRGGFHTVQPVYLSNAIALYVSFFPKEEHRQMTNLETGRTFSWPSKISAHHTIPYEYQHLY